MAVIKCHIQVNSTGTALEGVSHTLLSISQEERIIFTSNYADAAIKYTNGTPFGPDGPQDGKPFKIGLGPAEFTVANFHATPPLASFPFECGEMKWGWFTKWTGGGSQTPDGN